MFRFDYEVIKIVSESLKIYTIPLFEDRQTTYVQAIIYQDLLAILGIKFTPQSWQNIRGHCQFGGSLQSISINNQSARFFRVLDLPASIYFAAKSRSSMSYPVYQSLLNVYNSSSDSDKPNPESINTWLD